MLMAPGRLATFLHRERAALLCD